MMYPDTIPRAPQRRAVILIAIRSKDPLWQYSRLIYRSSQANTPTKVLLKIIIDQRSLEDLPSQILCVDPKLLQRMQATTCKRLKSAQSDRKRPVCPCDPFCRRAMQPFHWFQSGCGLGYKLSHDPSLSTPSTLVLGLSKIGFPGTPNCHGGISEFDITVLLSSPLYKRGLYKGIRATLDLKAFRCVYLLRSWHAR